MLSDNLYLIPDVSFLSLILTFPKAVVTQLREMLFQLQALPKRQTQTQDFCVLNRSQLSYPGLYNLTEPRGTSCHISWSSPTCDVPKYLLINENGPLFKVVL